MLTQAHSTEVEEDAIKFSEEMKLKFSQINHCTYQGQVYFQANPIAKFLEYKRQSQAIFDHVNKEDKVKFHQICNSERRNMKVSVSLQPESIFINKYGIFDLTMKSKMPLARQFRKWLVDEVLPSILETGSYVSQKRIHKIEADNQTVNKRLLLNK